MPSGKPPKYEPLRAFLESQPPDVAELTLTYGELAALVGSPLPPTAWTRAFWSNTFGPTHIQPQARAWRHAGWHVAAAAFRHDPAAVTFARCAPSAGPFGWPSKAAHSVPRAASAS